MYSARMSGRRGRSENIENSPARRIFRFPDRAGYSEASRNRSSSPAGDRKSTRLNSSHQIISYAVFCLKKKKELGRGEPRRNKSMDTLLAAYRVGARVSWRELSTSASAAGVEAGTMAQFVFFFNDTATTEIYTLSLHDALPI